MKWIVPLEVVIRKYLFFFELFYVESIELLVYNII